jgi:hypothetical protein
MVTQPKTMAPSFIIFKSLGIQNASWVYAAHDHFQLYACKDLTSSRSKGGIIYWVYTTDTPLAKSLVSCGRKIGNWFYFI